MLATSSHCFSKTKRPRVFLHITSLYGIYLHPCSISCWKPCSRWVCGPGMDVRVGNRKNVITCCCPCTWSQITSAVFTVSVVCRNGFTILLPKLFKMVTIIASLFLASFPFCHSTLSLVTTTFFDLYVYCQERKQFCKLQRNLSG